MLDLVIKDVAIADGTGKPIFHGDVGIAGDRIAEVGKVTSSARRTIEGEGHLLTPGFVDIHTHYDGQVCWDEVLAPSSDHGVTSIVMGNCGVGFAPVRSDHHEKLIGLLEGVEDIPGTALTEGLTWNWESYPEYLDALSKRKFAIDVAGYIPHAALRTYVMGDRGTDHEAIPTDSEIDHMEQLTFEAVQAGAMGFSTSRSLAHRTIDGDNIGTLTASERELSFAARALRRAGTGVLQLISDAYMAGDDKFVELEMRLMRHLSTISGRPLSFSLMQFPGLPDRWKTLIAETDKLVSEGHVVRTQVAPRPVGVILGWGVTMNPFFLTPTNKALAGLALAEKVRQLRQPEIKARMLEEYRNAERTPLTSLLTDSIDSLYRMTDPVDYEPRPDTSIGAEAAARGLDPVDHVYDVLLEEEGTRLLYLPVMNYPDGNLNSTFSMLSAPNSLFGLSDGGAHCGSVCDASFPTSALALWMKGNRDGLRISVEQLVHGYTQKNAAYVGWLDRGVIAPGYLSDINIIDLDALALAPPSVVQDLPAGGHRLLQKSRGYRFTIKRGKITFEGGKWTGELPGQVVRGAQARLGR